MQNDHLKKKRISETYFLTGYIQCKAKNTIDLLSKGAFLCSGETFLNKFEPNYNMKYTAADGTDIFLRITFNNPKRMDHTLK